MNHIIKYTLLSLLVFFNSSWMTGQTTPANPQTDIIAIVGGTIHVGNGEIIQNGIIQFEKGKITYVGNEPQKIAANARKINATGKEIYPGFIAANTNLGLNEIEQVKATIDESEIGAMNANIRSIIAYNTDSRVQATLRSNGVLLAEVAPRGGIISGQSSLVQLDAWNWEDASICTDCAIHLNWPSPYRFNGWWAEPAASSVNEKYVKEVDRIKLFFDEAYAYSKNPPTAEKNLRYEAMLGVFNGTKKLMIHASLSKAIIAAVLFAKEYNLTPVIVDGEDSWRITSFLKEHNVPVLLSETHNLPQREDDDIDINFKTPKLLNDAGILFGLKLNGFWQQRNLPFQAGQMVAFGLDKEKAIASITGNIAKIFGQKNIGTIEVNKDATLFISEGDALDMKTNRVTSAFIQGREIDLNNHQKDLYQKYMNKYHPKN